jgi:hypothetical protein
MEMNREMRAMAFVGRRCVLEATFDVLVARETSPTLLSQEAEGVVRLNHMEIVVI